MKNVLVWIIINNNPCLDQRHDYNNKKCVASIYCKHYPYIHTFISMHNDWSVIYFYLEFQNAADLVKHYKDRQTQLRSKETTSEKDREHNKENNIITAFLCK